MKRISKLLSILLVLFILVGCGEDSSPSAENYYLTQLKNYQVREKNSTLDDNAEFDAYLDTDEKVDIVLNDILSGKIKTNDDFGYKVLEIDCGFDIRVKEN